jgi:hypothetical protein
VARLVPLGSTLTLRLSRLERLGALVGEDPRVELVAVRSVRATADPWAELRGIRAPGTGLPGLIALGTRRSRAGRDFAAVYRRGPGVVVDCEGAPWARIVVSSDEAEAVAAEVARAAGRD